MKKILAFAILTLGFSCAGVCTNPERARSTLEASGFTSVEIVGWSRLKCSDNDATCTTFIAIGPGNRPVSGAVGCGRFSCSKGCTIRLD